MNLNEELLAEKNEPSNVVMQKFNERYEYSKDAKSPFHSKWNKYIKLYKGDHWHSGLAAHRPKTVQNMIFSLIESQLPLMMDRNPSIHVKPQTPADSRTAYDVNNAIKHVWESIGMNQKLTASVRDSLMFGTGILKMYWDTEKYSGMGEIGVTTVDNFDLFIDPHATSPEEAEYMIYRTRMPLRKLRQRFPENGHKVQDNAVAHDTDGSERPREDSGRLKGKGIADVFEHWYYDEMGQIRVATIANGVLLEDKETPFEMDEFPFIFIFDYKITGQFWGIGEIEQLAPLQEELNKMRQIIVENTLKTTNTVWLVDRNSGVDPKGITDRAGQVIQKNPSSQISRLAPENLPQSIYNQVDNTKLAMEEISGVSEITRGVVSSGISSAAAIDILTQNATVRLKAKLKNVEFAIQKLGRWFIALMRQFYSEPRLIRLNDDASREYQFSSVDFTQLRQEETTIDPETGEEKTIVYLTEFDIVISSGSSMLMNKASQYQQALELFRSGAMDLETLLEYAELGEPKKIVERLTKYGIIEDPNAPKITADKLIRELNKHVKFNVSSTDPFVVHDALSSLMTQAEQMEAQNVEELQEGQDIQQQMNAQLPPQEPPMY